MAKTTATAVRKADLAADIPKLKSVPSKKDKERKKGGLFWQGARTGGAGAHGARTAANVIARLASSATEGAPAMGEAALASFSPGRWLALILGSLLVGKLLMTFGLSPFMPSGLYPSLSLGSGWGKSEFSPLRSSIRPRKPDESRSLGYAAQAAKGELKFSRPFGAEAPKEEAPAKQAEAPAQPKAEEAPPPPKPDWGSIMANAAPTLQHNMTNAILSTSLGAGFGLRDIFNNNSSAPKFGSSLAPLAKGGTGKLTAFARAQPIQNVGNVNHVRGFSQRAMGQLKLAQMLSAKGGSSTGNEAPKTLAADAFDQSITQGGELAKGGPDASPTPTVLGSGAPDVSPPANAAAWQPALDKAKDNTNQAGQNKTMSMILMVLGIALIILGCCIMATSFGAGLALIIAGALMVMMSIMMLMQAQGQAAQAAQQAAQIQNQNGQTTQAQVTNDCASQAVNNGTNSSNCRPTTQVPDKPNDTQQAVDKEGSSTYDLDGGHVVSP